MSEIGMVQSGKMAALLGLPNGLCSSFEVGTLSAPYESSTVETRFVQSDERLIRDLVKQVDNELLAVLEARSAVEFANIRDKVLSKYVKARRALSDTMSNLASESDMAVITKMAASTFSEDLEKQRGSRFSNTLIEQTAFTLWTLKKINLLSQKVVASGDPRDRALDQKLCSEYNCLLLWSQFHFDTVAAAMKFKKTISDRGVENAICEGLRAAVNAFVILKDALELRITPVETAPVADLPWDDEDERLLAASMRDMNDFADSEDHN